MREGVVWQDALPPMLVSLADHLVADCECAVSLTYVEHVACSNLHTRKLCERTICCSSSWNGALSACSWACNLCVYHHAVMPGRPGSEHAICAQYHAIMPL